MPPNQWQHPAWDAQNHLSAVTYTNRTTIGGGGGGPLRCSTSVTCVFLPLVMQQTPAERYGYDADGVRVRKETKTEVTRYIGPHFEVTVGITNSQVLTTTKYYDFGGQRIAVRQITPQTNTLSYLHGDHLGSTSVATSASGAKTSDVRYFAYGGQRGANSILALPTDHTFTGQKLDKGTGLLYYGARYYDSVLGVFVSPDSIVPSPGDPQSLNRYAYVRNNPLRYTDPTGMFSEDEIMKYYGVKSWDEVLALYEKGGRLEGLWGWLETLRRAELGDRVTIWDQQCQDPRCKSGEGGLVEFFDGTFAEQDGQLVVFGGTRHGRAATFSADAVALIGRTHYGYSAHSFLTRPQEKYYQARWQASSQVDWLDVSLNAGGIGADLLTAGAGGRVVNGIQVAQAAKRAGDVLDLVSLHKSSYALAVSLSQGAATSESTRDVALDLMGVAIPVLPDVISLWYDLFRWSP
jgi:RHS repeat-associated protein